MAAIEASGRARPGRVAPPSAEARASTDALTGLPNRRYFDEFCALLGGRRRVDDAIGILMVDIDHFKRVNDRFGHDAGDDVLRAVGGAIAGAVREGDVPARFGGEEFAILLRNPSGRVAIEVAERVRSGRRRARAADARAVRRCASRSGRPCSSVPTSRSPSCSLARTAPCTGRSGPGRDRVEAA